MFRRIDSTELDRSRLRYGGLRGFVEHSAMQQAHTTVPAPVSDSQFLAWVEAWDERYELVEGIAMNSWSHTQS